jgi:signal peptidase II
MAADGMERDETLELDGNRLRVGVRRSAVLFMVVTVVALGMIVYFHRAFAGRSLWLQALLGLILGGTLGNLVDRVRQGYVTDFVSFGFGSTRFPTFNVADSSIVVGIGTLVIVLMLLDRQQETVTA